MSAPWSRSVDKGAAIGFAALVFGAALAGSLALRRYRPATTLSIGATVIAAIVAMPFFLPWSSGQEASSAPAAPVYSFKEAKANPAAFARWWSFFVDEVVRTNALVFEKDPNSAPGHEVLLPKPDATADFYKGRIAINNRGYRGGDLATSKGSAFRILTVGDSATFGQTLFPDSKPWSSVLQDLISSNLKCARPIEVVKGGVNGFHVRHAIARIERDFPWLQPDMVLSYFGWNTTADIGVESPAEETSPPAGRPAQVWWYIQKAAAAVVSGTATSIGRIIREDGDDVSGLLTQARGGSTTNSGRWWLNPKGLDIA